MNMFDELKASLEEAVEIKQGLLEPAARTRYEVADVKAIRLALNVSQQEFAQALGTSVDTVKVGRPGAATRLDWQRRS
ncbi:NadS family protein [Aeromonas salmonicida subsp. salmonicida]|uniref:NadS family protein n=1 Tax=Aeromonas salmonicida TaxID=645 RepID=UPI001EE405F2|nr:NadS family protein [Aeromonas salmonicida]WCB54607.1 NadS family protein [Aeromonas salmonicida subsp. salmonicida]